MSAISPPDQEFDPQQGVMATDLQQRNDLTNQGYSSCAHPGCGFMHAPGLADTQTCPNCGTDPWQAQAHYDESIQQQLFNPGGGTRSGLPLNGEGSQAKIAEDLVQGLGSIEGYGPITWWSSDYKSPLDGATAEWGIEVKSANVDNVSYKMDPRKWEIESKNQMARLQGYRGILGVIVVLDFRRSLADIYVRAFPFPEGGGNTGLKWRANDSFKLMKEVPFDNPYMNPNSDVPQMPKEEMPF